MLIKLNNKRNSYYDPRHHSYERYFDPELCTTRHPFHILPPSPWPFMLSIAVFFLVVATVNLMHGNSQKWILFIPAILYFCLILFCWFRDIIVESTIYGKHTRAVRRGIRLGMILFIISEVMFFFSFFWAFFHSSLSPSIFIGCIWPPLGINVIKYNHLPLVNTLILLSSGVTITWAHLAVVLNISKSKGIIPFIITIFYAILFTGCQLHEYQHASFDISDGIYGSIFYLATGFHGFHVIIGTLMIIVTTLRYISFHFTSKIHVGLECTVWYWHFVDIVWIALYIFIYCWGNGF